MSDDRLHIVPLGGLGEVGMNCLLYEHGDDAIMIDCGVMFHDEDIGVDIIHPVFDYVVGGARRLHAVVVTHGHEDHIGALPFLLRRIDVPVYATPLVARLVEARLKQMPMPWSPRMIGIHEGSRLEIGPFQLQFAGVNHSIPQALAVYIRTPSQSVLHSSDFKIGSASDPDLFDRERLTDFRRQGIDLLLSDSTNIEKPGLAGEEETVTRCLSDIVREAPARVFVTLFPSNIRRVGNLLTMARELGRSVVPVGRAVDSYMGAARGLGLLPSGPTHPGSPADAPDGEEAPQLLLVSGSQGEQRSAMSKIARQEHRKLRIRDDDLFIFSSRRIPGNEMAIGRVMSQIARQGGTILHVDNTPDVHVSGHGHRGDLEAMLHLASPASFVPIHGNYHYLKQHAALARETGIADIMVVENGETLTFSREEGLRRAGLVPAGKVHVDGSIEVGEEVLDARRSMGEGGVVAAIVILRGGRGAPPPTVRMASSGVFERDKFEGFEEAARAKVEARIEELVRAGTASRESIGEEAKRTLEKYYSKHLSSRPLVTVEVVEIEE